GEAFGLLTNENPWKPFYSQMLGFRKNNPMRRNMPVRYGGCDACTAFVFAHPECAVLEDYFVVCETRSTVSDGQTVVDWTGRFGEKPNVKLARSVDRDAYAAWYLECLRSFEGGNGNE
ncbi:MAG: nucleoside hydrolase, partial [Oscillospiraceae bacterium]|nr:nucleoside hydrolase [Oscillospiraceae bacterium]